MTQISYIRNDPMSSEKGESVLSFCSEEAQIVYDPCRQISFKCGEKKKKGMLWWYTFGYLENCHLPENPLSGNPQGPRVPENHKGLIFLQNPDDWKPSWPASMFLP